jgi:hypothetical protein
MRVFVDMADRKLIELEEQQKLLQETIEELKDLRKTTQSLVASS